MNKKHKNSRLIEILAVEDNPADIRYMSEIFKEGRLANRVTAMRDGDSALRYLRGEGEFAGAVKPDLVLLDLNMPGMDGKKVLEEIRKDPALSGLPVIILTTSSAMQDVSGCYDLKANSYMVKPPDLGQLIKVAMCMENIGVALVAAPPPKLKPARRARSGGSQHA
ncbi:MAG TPA: response regulator [Elusimicrobiales bacterium]|nr:response regulator [Elusimicrobiales bacterium]